jgi:hypothetical protein
MAHGHVDSLSPGEIALSSAHSVRPPSINRAWNYWIRHVEKAGLMPAVVGAAKRSGAAATRRSKSKAAPKRKARKHR